MTAPPRSLGIADVPTIQITHLTADGPSTRRASVMDFIRLVEVAAAQAPAARPTAEFSDQDLPPAILRLQEQVARLRNAGDERDPTQTDQTGLTLCQLLLNVVSERLSKRRALSRKR